MVDCVQGLRLDGRFVLMGFEAKPLQLSPVDFITRRIRLLSSNQKHPEYLFESLDYAVKSRVKTVIEAYRLDEIGKAYDRVVNGRVRFRAVITP